MTAVHIAIDELVLHGVDGRDRDAIAEAVRLAIAAHLDASSIRARLPIVDGVDHLRAPDVTVPTAARGAQLGTGVGRAVAQAIGGDHTVESRRLESGQHQEHRR